MTVAPAPARSSAIVEIVLSLAYGLALAAAACGLLYALPSWFD